MNFLGRAQFRYTQPEIWERAADRGAALVEDQSGIPEIFDLS